MKYSVQVLLFLIISLSAGELTPPKISKFVSPHYPKHLKRRGVEGDVELQLLIDENGNVEHCIITKPINPLLDTLSLNAAKQLKFIPGYVENEAVAVEIPYVYSFSLKQDLEKLTNVVRIQGILTYKGSSQPIPNASIYYTPLEERLNDLPNNRILQHLGTFNNQTFEDQNLITTSDSSGKFYFYGIPGGKFRLTLFSDDTHSITVIDSLKDNRKLRVELKLEPLNFNEYEVVTTYKTHNEISERKLDIENLGTVAGSAGDPINALQTLPGVARTSGENIIFRGAHPDDNLFYLDDIEIPYLYHDGGRRSVVPSQALSEVSFYPSAYGAYYGTGVGGVMNAKTDLTPRKKINASADINLIDMGFFFNAAPLKNLQFTAGGRISDRTGFTKCYMEALEGDNAIFPRYADFFGKIRFTSFKDHTIDLIFLGAKDSLVTPTNGELTDPHDYRSFNTLGIVWNWKFSHKLNQMFSYGYLYQSDGHKRTVPAVIWNRYKNKMRSQQFRGRWDWNISQSISLHGGINGDIREIFYGVEEYLWSRKAFTSHISGAKTGTISPWTELSFTPLPPLNMRLGMRYDYYSELQHSGTIYPAFSEGSGGKSGFSGDPSIRLAITYQLNDKNLIKMALGNYNQSPKPFGKAIDSTIGNPLLPTTKAAHYTLGYELLSGNYSIDIQGYYNSRWNIPYCSSIETPHVVNEEGELIRADSSYTWYEDGIGRSYGAELLIRRLRSERFSGWLSYTISKSEEKTFGDFHPIDYDQTHNLQLLCQFYLSKRWEIGGRFHYTTGNPTTPVELNSDINNFENHSYNSERLDPGVQLDIRLSQKLLTQKVTTEIYFDVQNLLYPIYKTQEYVEYNPDTGEEIIYYTPIIQTLGVKVSF